MHSIPTSLAGAGDTILRSPDWPLGLAALLPVPRPGRVAIRWRGHLEIDKLIDLFGYALRYAPPDSRHIAAVVITGNHLERLPLRSSPQPLLNYIAEHDAPEFLRIEAIDPERNPYLVAWINHDATPLDTGAESQQAAGVEVTVKDAPQISDGVARALSSTSPPEDASQFAQSAKEVLQHVMELMADITEISGTNLGRAS